MEELCNVAESLIVPVRMGIARPTAPFTLASTSIDAVQGSEELFSVEPLPPRPSPDQSSRLNCSIFMAKTRSCFITSLVWGKETIELSPFYKLKTTRENNIIVLVNFCSSSQTAASYIIRNPQPRHSSQSQPVRGRDEEQDDIVSADVEEVRKYSCTYWVVPI